MRRSYVFGGEKKELCILDEPLKDVLRRWKKYVRSDESWMK